MIVKIIPFLIAAAMSVYFLLEKSGFDQQGKRLEEQRDSLELIIETQQIKVIAFQRMITLRDDRIDNIKIERDSIKEYQNKIYIYYERKLKSLDTLTNTEQLELFYALTN